MANPNALLLDEIKPVATQAFETADFSVNHFAKNLHGDELDAKLAVADVIGVRSGPNVTREMLETSVGLLAVGVYGVGTDHVDVASATEKGIAVFNAPYENGRSVAELVIGSTFSLMRRLHEHNLALHEGRWTKTDEQSYEVRGKTLGIIGYGNIGQQAGAIAEGFGMDVRFYDLADRPRLGNSRPTMTLEALLEASDIVSIHVPGRKPKKEGEPVQPIIGERELALMKPGSKLINTSRANALDTEALLAAVRSGHLSGAALDVFPNEPKSKKDPFESDLREEPRILLTPHIGGSTQEAQVDAARSVSQKLIGFTLNGSSAGSVNLPNIELPRTPDTTRFTYIHANESGAIAEIGTLISREELNVVDQRLRAEGDVGYAIIDVEGTADEIDTLPFLHHGLKHAIRLRIL